MARLWGVLYRKSDLALDGPSERLLPVVPWAFHGPAVFRTRREAREFIQEKYGYIRHRTDLHAYPHGDRMPIPVKIEIVPRQIDG
jgi:hypothetical protein